MIPSVIIIGRPNVGKSTLFNKLTKSRSAIVHDQPGVTRDIKSTVVEWNDRQINLLDSGGIVPDDPELIPYLIQKQVFTELENSDLVLFIIDVKEGVIPIEQEIAERLRSSGKEIILVGNKTDEKFKQYQKNDLFRLGFDTTLFISAEHSLGIDTLMDKVVELLPSKSSMVKKEEPSKKIAIVGRPNVGKSTLVNNLLQQDRLLVSNIPGTTRDVVDVELTYKKKKFIILDTAGIRKKSKIMQPAEIYSVLKARETIKKADITVFLTDASSGFNHQDVSLARLINESARGVALVINKWDTIENPDARIKELKFDVEDYLPHISYAPLITISALQGKRVFKLLDFIYSFFYEKNSRISTPDLNKAIMQYYTEKHPPAVGTKKYIKLNYATQTLDRPCKIMLFSNRPEGIKESYLNYLSKRLRTDFDLSGIPIHIKLKKK